MTRKLTEDECRILMENGELTALIAGTDDAAGVSPCVAVILTQSWCPQWKEMKTYLPQTEVALPSLNIYYAEYDVENWQNLSRNDFMAFKENTLRNSQIPYVRYYKDGKFLGSSNYVPLKGFIAAFEA